VRIELRRILYVRRDASRGAIKMMHDSYVCFLPVVVKFGVVHQRSHNCGTPRGCCSRSERPASSAGDRHFVRSGGNRFYPEPSSCRAAYFAKRRCARRLKAAVAIIAAIRLFYARHLYQNGGPALYLHGGRSRRKIVISDRITNPSGRFAGAKQ